MEYIELVCLGQRLRLKSVPDGLVRGTRGYLGAHVTFEDGAWDGRRVAADFGGDARPLINGACVVPDDVAASRRIDVRLVGEDDASRIATNWVAIYQGGD